LKREKRIMSMSKLTANNPPTFPVVSPQTPRTAQSVPLAPRLDTLEGKTLAFVWDYLFRGDEIWALLKEGLSARYAGMKFVDFDMFGSTHGGNEREIVAGLAAKMKALGVDAYLSGMGC
jgi:hypothetical protein